MNAHDSMTSYVAARAPHLAPQHRAATPASVRTRRRGFSAAHLVAVAIVGALIGLWISPGRAYAADPVADQPGGVYVSRVSQYPMGPGITVTLSNNSGERVRTDVLTPCVYEDGRRCYWQSDRRGNGIGTDFLVMSGRVFVMDLSWIGDAR